MFSLSGCFISQMRDMPRKQWHKLIGSKIPKDPKEVKDLRVAVICNWNDCCGISTYSKFIVEAIKPKVKELKIFSEICPQTTGPDEPFVTRCWKRGTSMKNCLDAIKAYNPDFIIIQHEFGIFPKATHFLQMLQALEDIPYIVTLHSVYEHLDKSVCTSAIKNIVVHTEQGKDILRKTGNNSNIFVIPHGCMRTKNESELWNIFQTPYALVQFGFGFYYKGVDVVLQAIHHLKTTQTKFKDIFYCYLCSENLHTSNVHANYYNYLTKMIEDLDLVDNVTIIRKFQTETTINAYLRTAKIALFPYVSDPKNKVYGASGAVRMAMAVGTPVIGSSSSQFDDLDGVVPRPKNYIELAKEIDEIFSNDKHRQNILDKMNKYIDENTWDICADRYLAIYKSILN